MKIAVVDDLVCERAEIVSCIEEYCTRRGIADAVFTEFASAEDFSEAIEASSFDVAVLDIIMGEMNGMEAAHALRRAQPSCAIIFVTSSRDFSIEGYRVHAAGYVLKPVADNKELLFEALSFAAKRAVHDSASMMVKCAVGERHVLLADIMTLTKQFLIIYLELKDGETFALSGKYSDYEHRLLDDGRFIKTGRSQLLNADRISAVTHEGFLLDNGKEISLGRRVRERTAAEYARYKVDGDRNPKS